MDNKILVIGTVTRPQGIRGEVRIQPMTDKPEDFVRFRHAYVQKQDGTRLAVSHARVLGNMIIAAVQSSATRNDAETLRGLKVMTERHAAPRLEKDAYFIADLEGCTVVDETGHVYGTVREVMQPGANDVYVVEGEQGSILMPAIAKLIRSVAIDERTITVDAAVVQEVAVFED